MGNQRVEAHDEALLLREVVEGCIDSVDDDEDEVTRNAVFLKRRVAAVERELLAGHQLLDDLAEIVVHQRLNAEP